MTDPTSFGASPVYPIYPGVIPGLGLPGPGAGLPPSASPGVAPPSPGASAMGAPSALSPPQNRAIPALNPVLTPGAGAAAGAGPRPGGFPLADLGAYIQAMGGQGGR
jgi:hypothetical protein